MPLCETFRDDGYSTEEVKLLFETRKIMEMPELDVTMTCVRVPVPVGHSATVLIETERPLTPDEARAALADFPGVRVVDDPAHNSFPTPPTSPATTRCWSAASAATSTATACGCGRCPTTCARAPPPTPCRSRKR